MTIIDALFNVCKVIKLHSVLGVMKYSFANRVASEWNRLLNSVIEARGINAFKGKLDGYLRNVRR